MSRALWLIVLLLGVPSAAAFSQAIPVGDLREEQFRLQQLLNPSLSHPFTNRGVSYSACRDRLDRRSRIALVNEIVFSTGLPDFELELEPYGER